MASSRRDFIQLSSATASALVLGRFGLGGGGDLAALGSQRAHDPAIRAIEAATLRARPVPLSSVRLAGGPLKHSQDITATYLLSLEPDRMLAYYRERAGLAPKAAGYGGWDGDGRNLTGHIAGHHLSVVSFMVAATGDARFKDRADYIVAELKAVQDARGDGYLSALEGCREAFAAMATGDIRSGAFNLNGLWSPWYTLHKTYAGLRDAYRFADNPVALDLLVKYAEWAERVLDPLTGAVTTRSGRRLTGRLVYDLDESENTETLDAPLQGVNYTIPFGLIASISPGGTEAPGAQRATVTLHRGQVLQLERRGDLGEANAGMLIFVEGREDPEYVPWTDVEQIDFDRSPR